MGLGRVGMALAVFVAGCGTVKGDVSTLCNASTVCPRDPVLSAADNAARQAACLSSKIRTNEGEKIIQAMSTSDPASRPALLRAAAAEQGLTSCPEANAMEKRAAPP